MRKFIVRIAKKGNRSKYRDVTIEAYTVWEAREIVEGQYPDYEIISVH
jgi:hypothetical protein